MRGADVLPRTNNVYGEIVAPQGLRAVAVVVEGLLGPGTGSLFRERMSQPTETLRIRTDTADFSSLPMPGGIEYVINGAVAGTREEVAAFVASLSAALTQAGIENEFRLEPATGEKGKGRDDDVLPLAE